MLHVCKVIFFFFLCSKCGKENSKLSTHFMIFFLFFLLSISVGFLFFLSFFLRVIGKWSFFCFVCFRNAWGRKSFNDKMLFSYYLCNNPVLVSLAMRTRGWGGVNEGCSEGGGGWKKTTPIRLVIKVIYLLTRRWFTVAARLAGARASRSTILIASWTSSAFAAWSAIARVLVVRFAVRDTWVWVKV